MGGGANGVWCAVPEDNIDKMIEPPEGAQFGRLLQSIWLGSSLLSFSLCVFVILSFIRLRGRLVQDISRLLIWKIVFDALLSGTIVVQCIWWQIAMSRFNSGDGSAKESLGNYCCVFGFLFQYLLISSLTWYLVFVLRTIYAIKVSFTNLHQQEIAYHILVVVVSGACLSLPGAWKSEEPIVYGWAQNFGLCYVTNGELASYVPVVDVYYTISLVVLALLGRHVLKPERVATHSYSKQFIEKVQTTAIWYTKRFCYFWTVPMIPTVFLFFAQAGYFADLVNDAMSELLCTSLILGLLIFCFGKCRRDRGIKKCGCRLFLLVTIPTVVLLVAYNIAGSKRVFLHIWILFIPSQGIFDSILWIFANRDLFTLWFSGKLEPFDNPLNRVSKRACSIVSAQIATMEAQKLCHDLFASLVDDDTYKRNFLLKTCKPDIANKCLLYATRVRCSEVIQMLLTEYRVSPPLDYEESHQTALDIAKETRQEHLLDYLISEFHFSQPKIIDFKDIQDPEELGGGNFGMLLKASMKFQTAENTFTIPVVLKLCKQGQAGTDEVYEAQVLKNVPWHPNLLGLLGICMDCVYRNALNFANIMPYKRGGSLESYIEKSPHGYLEEHEVLAFALDIVNGVRHLHKHKYLHRDIGARNCLLHKGPGECNTGFEQRVLICDFGLARPNPYFLERHDIVPWQSSSPECLAKMQCSKGSDIWMIGITIWEMQMGVINPPFYKLAKDINHLKNLFVSHANGGASLLELPYNCNYSRSIIERCCQIEPLKRPGSLKLKQYIEGARVRLEQERVDDGYFFVDSPNCDDQGIVLSDFPSPQRVKRRSARYRRLSEDSILDSYCKKKTGVTFLTNRDVKQQRHEKPSNLKSQTNAALDRSTTDQLSLEIRPDSYTLSSPGPLSKSASSVDFLDPESKSRGEKIDTDLFEERKNDAVLNRSTHSDDQLSSEIRPEKYCLSAPGSRCESGSNIDPCYSGTKSCGEDGETDLTEKSTSLDDTHQTSNGDVAHTQRPKSHSPSSLESKHKTFASEFRLRTAQRTCEHKIVSPQPLSLPPLRSQSVSTNSVSTQAVVRSSGRTHTSEEIVLSHPSVYLIIAPGVGDNVKSGHNGPQTYLKVAPGPGSDGITVGGDFGVAEDSSPEGDDDDFF